MNKVTLGTDGSILHNRKNVGIDPLPYLSFKVELEDGFTLRSYFRMLKKNPLIEKLNAFFPAFIEQYHKCPETGCLSEDFDHFELIKTVEMIGFPGKPRLEIYTTLNEICGTKSSEFKNKRFEYILDMQIRLGNLKHIVFGDKVDIFEFETVFNLFEFIDAIAWQLSFHAPPMHCELRR